METSLGCLPIFRKKLLPGVRFRLSRRRLGAIRSMSGCWRSKSKRLVPERRCLKRAGSGPFSNSPCNGKVQQIAVVR